MARDQKFQNFKKPDTPALKLEPKLILDSIFKEFENLSVEKMTLSTAQNFKLI